MRETAIAVHESVNEPLAVRQAFLERGQFLLGCDALPNGANSAGLFGRRAWR